MEIASASDKFDKEGMETVMRLREFITSLHNTSQKEIGKLNANDLAKYFGDREDAVPVAQQQLLKTKKYKEIKEEDLVGMRDIRYKLDNGHVRVFDDVIDMILYFKEINAYSTNYLADETDFNKSTVSAALNRHRKPSKKLIKKLGEVLNHDFMQYMV